MGANTDLFVQSAFSFLGRKYKEMDCQEFVERAMEGAGLIYNKAGSNTWYRSMTWIGTPEECKLKFGSVPKGAILFIVKEDGKEPVQYRNDGLHNANHMGIKTGISPGAIHSSESKGGVVESTFKDKTIKNGGWNRVGLWNKFDYGEKINNILNNEGGESMAEKQMTVIRTADAAAGSNTVNVRLKPDTGSAIMFSVPFGSSVTVYSIDGNWSQIAYGGRTGWMMNKFLADPDVTSVPAEVRENLNAMQKNLDNIFDMIGRG